VWGLPEGSKNEDVGNVHEKVPIASLFCVVVGGEPSASKSAGRRIDASPPPPGLLRRGEEDRIRAS